MSQFLQILQKPDSRELGSNIISYTTRATQAYREDQGNYNPYERAIEAKQRPGQNLPAESKYTMVMLQRNEHPHAVRVMHTALLNGWSRGWLRTHEIWSRPTTSATSTATKSRATSATTSTTHITPTTMSTATATSVQQHLRQYSISVYSVLQTLKSWARTTSTVPDK